MCTVDKLRSAFRIYKVYFDNIIRNAFYLASFAFEVFQSDIFLK